ncbi:MAG TPA: TlpA disulfide reductase family protein [Pyrinomonadaceae bacterium]
MSYKNVKPLLLIAFVSLLLSLAVSPLRGFINFQTSSLVGFTAYFFVTIYCLFKFEKSLSARRIFLALAFGLLIVRLPARIIAFEESLVTLPDLLLHFLGIVFGLLCVKVKKPARLPAALLGFAIAVYMFNQGYDLWLHKLNFGTFTGRVAPAAAAQQQDLTAKFVALDERKNLISGENFRDKIVLLDFWHTRCGICFEKFPQVQTVYDKYKTDSSVMIFAVDKPLAEDKPGEAFDLIKAKGYSFPVVVAPDADMPENFGVSVYPTTFVIDRAGKIVFKGDIAGAIQTVDNLKAGS